MARVAVLGERVVVGGYSLAGALVLAADTEDQVRRAWSTLPEDVGVVVLSPRAAQVLGDQARSDGSRLTVVIPR